MSVRLALPLELPDATPTSTSIPAPAPTPKTPALRPVRPVPPGTAPRSNRRRAVWLAMHLREWQLHAALMQLQKQERQHLMTQPLAVVEDDRKATLAACNALAHAHGVRAGHSLNAAIALCAELQFLPRQPAAETELLQQLATDCEQYTSFVSVEPPNELLLEVRGSFRLFGGIEALIARVRKDFEQRGLAAQIALTSTPQSALWLSRIATSLQQPIVVRPRELMPTLAKLPVSYLLWPVDIELRLARFGVLTIGDLLRLPRAGLARRIGHDHLAELDYAVGRHRQVRKSHRSPEHYEDRVLLDFEIETTSLMSTIIETRFTRLARFLARRTFAVDRVYIDLHHRDHLTTVVTIGLAAPTSDMAHVTKLMHEQLARLELPAPVIEATIRVVRLLPQPAGSRDLFDRTAAAPVCTNTEPQARLLEQLRSRLGEQAVQQLVREADHRPECANEMRVAAIDERSCDGDLPAGLARRPLWLLPTPRSIASSNRLSSSIVSGPEAIESGWWDGMPIHRDYFVARSSRGALAWIFRDRASSRVFVHGLFG